ncbi:MAG: transposase [Hyphomicrobium sp.]
MRYLVADKERRDGEIGKHRLIIKQLQRHQLGRRSEKLDSDQLALGFEDLDADIDRVQEKETQSRPPRRELHSDMPAPRGTLPEHLPRQDVIRVQNALTSGSFRRFTLITGTPCRNFPKYPA